MDKLIIRGGNQLNGNVSISGAKNAVLPIMASTLLTSGKFIINNVPDLRDTRTMSQLLREIGATVIYSDNTLEIDTTTCTNPVAPYDLVKTMRASFYVLGPLMGRFNHAEVSLPGGCAWGPRPVDIHLKALAELGADVQLNKGNIVATGNLTGGEIHLRFPSVGATGNILMAAVKANGKTKITNAALEPEITSLGEFLIELGANISGLGTNEITVCGVGKLKGKLEYSVIPDRIEAGTFLIGGALCGGKITLTECNPEHLESVILKLRESGSEIGTTMNSITIIGNDSIKPVNINTEPYPGFPTDLQAQWIAFMCRSNGTADVTEGIYHDRFTHISELNRFGADITLNNNTAIVHGVSELHGAPVMSTDIRASASLILAALAATGKSDISRIYHIDRGYENIEEKFNKLGGNIIRTNE